MISVSRNFEWDMGHRVTNHASLCRNPHGHRYKMEATISGSLITKNNDPQEGMIIDFGHIKNIINTCIVDKFDHGFMYWQNDEVLSKFAIDNPDLKFIKVPFIPTAECIAEDIAERIQNALNRDYDNLSLKKLVLHETPNCRAIWSIESGE